MEIYDVVNKLVGPIMPVGKTETDETRFENLRVMTELPLPAHPISLYIW
jgi:hypothetical protein